MTDIPQAEDVLMYTTEALYRDFPEVAEKVLEVKDLYQKVYSALVVMDRVENKDLGDAYDPDRSARYEIKLVVHRIRDDIQALLNETYGDNDD